MAKRLMESNPNSLAYRLQYQSAKAALVLAAVDEPEREGE